MKRDIRIDALRALAMLLIILAHVSPPGPLFVVRFFDVPLMACLLGMSYYLSEQKRATTHKKSNYFSYLWKRVKRLLFPAWLYVTGFLAFAFILNKLLGRPFPFSTDAIVKSYALIGGFGYVWIIGVFFAISVFSPLLYLAANKITTIPLKLISFTILLLIQKFLCDFIRTYHGSHPTLVGQIPIYFGYLIMAIVGIWMIKQNNTDNLIFLGYSGALLVFYLTKYNILSLPLHKYPPTLFYLAYGITVSIYLFLLVGTEPINKLIDNLVIKWISKYSLQLYYWHTFFVFLLSTLGVTWSWWKKYLVVVLCAVVMTLLQQKLSQLFKKKEAKPLLRN